jgi:hypothetical protein
MLEDITDFDEIMFSACADGVLHQIEGFSKIENSTEWILGFATYHQKGGAKSMKGRTLKYGENSNDFNCFVKSMGDRFADQCKRAINKR